MWHQKKLNTLLNPYIEILKSFIKPSSNNKKEPFTKDPFFSKPPLDKSWNKHTLNEKRPNKMPQIISCQADLMSFLKRFFSNWHDLVWKIVKKRLYKKAQVNLNAKMEKGVPLRGLNTMPSRTEATGGLLE